MIFTLNEEIHLPACLQSLAWCDDIIVVDSYSSDSTEQVCRTAQTRFFQHKFQGFGKQRNWAIENTDPKHDWILILDADERVPSELQKEIQRVMKCAPPNVGAYRLKRRFYMWGRWLRYSNLYPTWVVRLIHKDRVRYVNRGHAETQDVHGETLELQSDLIDENMKGIDEWFERQNRYARKEAEYELELERAPIRLADILRRDPLARRAALKRVACRLPGRAAFYFVYTYVIRKGFRDGQDGFMFCVMKAIYQAMIDVKKYDLQRRGSIK